MRSAMVPEASSTRAFRSSHSICPTLRYENGIVTLFSTFLASNFKEGDIIGEIAVEVETPPLLVTKPRDPEGKLREKEAEAREATERRRPSSNFFSRGLTLLDQV